ncbi:MAG: glutathione S-transferase family protein [Minicystis sp.]
MALEVFWASGSTPAWRVLLTLVVKGVPWDSHEIRLTRREQRRPDFLAVNPRGKVPAIRDGDFTLRESIAIMAYLDRRFPEPSLFGATAEESGRIHCLIAEHESYYRVPMLSIVRPILYGGPGALAGKDDDIRAAGAALREELARLDEALTDRAWLVGDRLSAADIAIYPNIKLVQRAASRPSAERFELALAPLEERFPHVATWCARIEAIPGYDVTYPPTWRDG